MKIAITGHTAGIGAAFAKCLSTHEIIGISKRDGNNIRNIPKIVDIIGPCDMWINNAQSGYAQAELLYKVWDAWQGQKQKMIWVVSTIMTCMPQVPDIAGLSMLDIAEYKNQKRALEDAFYQLRYQGGGPRMILIRPGAVATQPGQVPNVNGADPDAWATAVCDFYRRSIENNLWIEEISLGFSTNCPSL